MTDGPYDFSQVHAAMDRLVDDVILPGVSISIQKDQTTIDRYCAGWADRENGIKLTPRHVFRGFSNTKLVTSCAALLLVEKGALNLDDPLEKFLPEFGNLRVLKANAESLEDTVPADRSISLRHLLTHTSGIAYDFLSQGSLIADAYSAANLRDPGSNLADMVTKLAGVPLVCQPGTGWNYSFSTDVVARVVEVAGGRPFGQFLQEHIFDPLGMEDTGLWVQEDKSHLLVRLYGGANPSDPNEPGLTPVDDATYGADYFRAPALESGGGGLLFTLNDMVKLLNALDLQNGQLLGRDTRTLIYRNILPDGLWMQFPSFGELTGKGHSAACAVSSVAFPNEHPDTAGTCWWGGVAGTQWWMSAEHGISVAVMTQRENAFAHPFATELRNLVYEALADKATGPAAD